MSKSKAVQIFIADDDDVLIFKETIEILYPVAVISAFKNGRELCQKIQKNTFIPDIIFLDINMPIMNGLECLLDLRKHQRFNDVPIIMYSTSAHDNYLDQAFAGGANLFIRKATTMSKQAEIIKKIMELFAAGKLSNAQRDLFELSAFHEAGI